MNKSLIFYVFMFVSLACVLAAFVTAIAGMTYYYEGYGLHPLIAGFLVCFFVAVGYLYAHRAQQVEDDLS